MSSHARRVMLLAGPSCFLTGAQDESATLPGKCPLRPTWLSLAMVGLTPHPPSLLAGWLAGSRLGASPAQHAHARIGSVRCWLGKAPYTPSPPPSSPLSTKMASIARTVLRRGYATASSVKVRISSTLSILLCARIVVENPHRCGRDPVSKSLRRKPAPTMKVIVA